MRHQEVLEWKRTRDAAVAERDELRRELQAAREALRTAREDIIDLAGAGFDSTRRKIGNRALVAIGEALKEPGDPGHES